MDEGTLKITLAPTISEEGLAKLKEQLSNIGLGNLSVGTAAGASAEAGSTDTAGTDKTTDLGKKLDEAAADSKADKNEAAKKEETEKAEQKDQHKEEMAEDDEKTTSRWSKLGSALNVGWEGLQVVGGFMGKVWDGFSEFISYLRKTSPLLDAVLNIWDLAWTIFFRPIATALGVRLVPMMEELLNSAVEASEAIWEAYEEDGLTGMIVEAFKQGKSVLSGFFEDMWDLFPEDGLLGQFAVAGKRLTTWLVDGNGLTQIVNAIIYVATLVTKILAAVASTGGMSGMGAIGGAMSGAMLGGTVGGPWGMLIGGIVGGLAGYYMGNKADNASGMADGGLVDPTPGGSWHLLGEGGQPEWVVPKSQERSFARNVLGGQASNGNTYIYNINGYTDSQLTDYVTGVSNRQTNMSRLRSGF